MATMLVTLQEMKDYLGLTGVDYDTFLTEQIQTISEAIENYCGRKFTQASYTEIFYKDDMERGTAYYDFYSFHYPVISLTSILGDGEDITSNCRLYKDQGRIKNPITGFNLYEEVEVSYDAGYVDIPMPIKDVVYSLVEERYNKKTTGVGINFGNNVQRMSIPGTISIDFDYTLNSNERKSGFGMILGDFLNVLDFYRSERALIGKIKDSVI